MTRRASCLASAALSGLVLGTLPVLSAPLQVERTRSGVIFSDDFDDGVLDTARTTLEGTKWVLLPPDVNEPTLAVQEANGVFRVWGTTGSHPVGQHVGIWSNYKNPSAYNGWAPAQQETLEVVSVVDMWNTVASVVPKDGLTARMVNHLCGAQPDNNSTVLVGYWFDLFQSGLEPRSGWGARIKWDVWTNIQRSVVSLFGAEENRFFPTMADNFDDSAYDSTFTTCYVHDGADWNVIGSRENHLKFKRTELKTMVPARNHFIDYRWDNYRLFLNSKSWPVTFQLVDPDTTPLTGDWVLEVRRSDTGALVDRDTLDAASRFSISLDHTTLVIPQSLDLVLREDFTTFAAAGAIPAAGVDGCYPHDAYRLVHDPTVTSAPEPAAPGPALRVHPNPFAGRAVLRWAVPSAGSATITIVSVSGRRVRAFEVRGPTGSVVWDGTDSSGRPSAPGTYFVRLCSGELEESRTVTLVR